MPGEFLDSRYEFSGRSIGAAKNTSDKLSMRQEFFAARLPAVRLPVSNFISNGKSLGGKLTGHTVIRCTLKNE